MTNPVKGEVPLNLKGGRELTLVLDHEALIAAEAAYGKPLIATMIDAIGGFAGACRCVLYGALRAHHPDVTLAEATTIFMAEMDTVQKALEAAAVASAPKADKAEGKKRARPPRARAGKSSGASGAKSVSSPKPSSGRRRERSRSS